MPCLQFYGLIDAAVFLVMPDLIGHLNNGVCYES